MDDPGIRQIPLAELSADDSQPRHGEGDAKALDALKASMDQLGRTVQYVTVSPRDGGGYRILSGHRRVRAARELGWEWLPAVVVDDVANEVDRRLRQIAENTARAALRPIELCEAIDELSGRVEPAQIARATGVSLRTVYNYLGILEHPDLVEALRHGRALRAVLADVAARNQAAGAPATGPAAAPTSATRRAAHRRARRSVAHLREVWAALDEDHRKELAAELQSLLEGPERGGPEPPPPPSATLH